MRSRRSRQGLSAAAGSYNGHFEEAPERRGRCQGRAPWAITQLFLRPLRIATRRLESSIRLLKFECAKESLFLPRLSSAVIYSVWVHLCESYDADCVARLRILTRLYAVVASVKAIDTRCSPRNLVFR